MSCVTVLCSLWLAGTGHAGRARCRPAAATMATRESCRRRDRAIRIARSATRPAGPPALTLDEAVRIAVASSPGRRAVEARARAWRESAAPGRRVPQSERRRPHRELAARRPRRQRPAQRHVRRADAAHRVERQGRRPPARRRGRGRRAHDGRQGRHAPARRSRWRTTSSAPPRARGRRDLLDMQRESTREVVTILGRRVAEGVAAGGRPAEGGGRPRPPGHRGDARAGRPRDEPRVAGCVLGTGRTGAARRTSWSRTPAALQPPTCRRAWTACPR